MSTRSLKGAGLNPEAATFSFLSLHFLRSQGRTAVIWGLSLGFLSALTVAMFPSMSQGPDLSAYLDNLSPEMVALFGLEGNMNTIEGWLAAQIFNLWAPLVLAFYPILLGAGAIAGAEERGKLDILLSNPLPRWQLVMATFVMMTLTLLLALAVLALVTWLPAALLNVDLSLAATLAATVNLLPLCLFFGAFALVMSAFVRRTALAVAVPGAVLVAMYFLNALGSVVAALEPLQPLSLFYYYGSALEEGVHWASFGIILVLAFALAAIAAVIFNRRDIYT